MRHRGRTGAVVGGVLGWAVLLAVSVGKVAERYRVVLQKSQLQFKGYSLLVNTLPLAHVEGKNHA
jgi:hypothetical protein